MIPRPRSLETVNADDEVEADFLFTFFRGMKEGIGPT
jgi:hypothetical protein